MREIVYHFRSALRVVSARLDRFFFEFSAPMAVALFRIAFGSVLLLNFLLRFPHTDFYFSNLGIVPSLGAAEIRPEFYQPLLTWYPTSLLAAYAVEAAVCVGLLLLIAGAFGRIGTRLLTIGILAGHLSFIQRNYSVMYGADFISSFWLFGLCFMNSTERLSIRWSTSSASGRLHPAQRFAFADHLPPDVWWSWTLTSVGIRIVQIQLCLIYLYTGFEKLRGPDWWEQTAVWKVLGNAQLMTTDLSFLRNAPLIIGALTWGTVLFEIYAPILFWIRAMRKWTLLAGWGLHVGIAATMGLYVFSLTMMATYILFCDDRWLARLVSDGRQRIAGAS